jgi:hypothetical protein
MQHVDRSMRLVVNHSPQRFEFDTRRVLVVFVVEKVAVGQVFLRILRFSLFTIAPSMPRHWHYNLPSIDVILYLQLRTSIQHIFPSLTSHWQISTMPAPQTVTIYFVLWPTNAQLFHKLSHCYMFRHYRVILRELLINTAPSYTSISNAAVGNTVYN